MILGNVFLYCAESSYTIPLSETQSQQNLSLSDNPGPTFKNDSKISTSNISTSSCTGSTDSSGDQEISTTKYGSKYLFEIYNEIHDIRQKHLEKNPKCSIEIRLDFSCFDVLNPEYARHVLIDLLNNDMKIKFFFEFSNHKKYYIDAVNKYIVNVTQNTDYVIECFEGSFAKNKNGINNQSVVIEVRPEHFSPIKVQTENNNVSTTTIYLRSGINLENEGDLYNIWTQGGRRHIVNHGAVYVLESPEKTLTSYNMLQGNIKKSHGAEFYYIFFNTHYDNLINVMACLCSDVMKTQFIDHMFSIFDDLNNVIVEVPKYGVLGNITSHQVLTLAKCSILSINIHSATVKDSLHFHVFGPKCTLLKKIEDQLCHIVPKTKEIECFELYEHLDEYGLCLGFSVECKYSIFNLIKQKECIKFIKLLKYFCGNQNVCGLMFPVEYWGKEREKYTFYVRGPAFMNGSI
jgi:hypothetical protein